jgi:hypothetical protein
MRSQRNRRPAGTCSLYIRRDKAGRESWYAQWRDASGRQVKRATGPKRKPGTRIGLTKPQAERELRRLIDRELAAVNRHERFSVAEVGTRYLDYLGGLNRRPSTLTDYESTLRVHLAPAFAGRGIDQGSPPTSRRSWPQAR